MGAFEREPLVTSGSFVNVLAAHVYMMSSVCEPFLPQPAPTATGYTKDPSGEEAKGSAANGKRGSCSEPE